MEGETTILNKIENNKRLTKEDEDWILNTCSKVPTELRSSFEKLLRAYKECKR